MVNETMTRRTTAPTRRRRRGAHVIEFALTLPFFMLVFTGIIEFSWYFFQRAGVVDAARIGCHEAATLNPATDDFAVRATSVALEELQRVRLACGGGDCNVEITDLSAGVPARVVCEIDVPFTPITGFIGGIRGSDGLVPATLRGRSVAIFGGQ